METFQKKLWQVKYFILTKYIEGNLELTVIGVGIYIHNIGHCMKDEKRSNSDSSTGFAVSFDGNILNSMQNIQSYISLN